MGFSVTTEAVSTQTSTFLTQPRTVCAGQLIDGKVLARAEPAIADEERGFRGRGPRVMQRVLLRGAAQARIHLFRFLAERSADFLDDTTPHNRDAFLGTKRTDRTRTSCCLSMAARNSSSPIGVDGMNL